MSEGNNTREREDKLSISKPYAYLLNNTIITRQRLLSKSPVKTHKKLTILEAPVGFGKTVLMAQWANSASFEGFSTSWYKISPEDNSRKTLFSNLFNLLKHELPLTTRIDEKNDSIENFKELSQQITKKHIIFINNLETLKDNDSIVALNNLIEFGSLSLFLVIASNKRDIIPISAYRAHNQLTHIGANDLKFTREEISILFQERLDEKQLQYLDKVTNGWPVALWYERYRYENNNDQLILPTEPDLIPLSSDLEEFINEQIFITLEPDLRDVLVKMSIFQSFTIKQAKHVCDVKDVESIILKQHLSPLFFSAGEKAGDFCFNPLFHQFLRKKLLEKDASEIKLLHERAANWHENQGEPYEAIYHASQADDIKRMSELFMSFGGVEIGLREGIKTLERIVSLFPLEIGETEPQLLLSRVLMYIKDGKLEIGHSFLDRAGRKIAEDGADPSLEYYKSIVVMLMAVYEDKQVGIAEIAQFEDYAKQLMSERFWSQGWFNNLLCMMYYSVGDLIKARETALISLEFYNLSGAVYSQIFIHIHLALIENVFGNLKQSRQELELARDLCHEHFAPDAGLTAIVLVLLADLTYEQGDEKTARQLISKSLEKIEEHEGWVEVFTRGYVTASYLEFNDGSIEDAFKILDRGTAIAQRRNLPRLTRIMEIQKLELLTLSGNSQQALSSIKSLSLEQYLIEPDKLRLVNFQETYRTVHALARYCLDNDMTENALRLLNRVIAVQKRSKHNSFLVKSTLLKVLALDRSGQQDLADDMFQNIIEQFHAQEFTMSFLNEGKPLRSFINGHIKRVTLSKMPDAYVSFIGGLLAKKEAVTQIKDETNVLTPKELEVLKNLSLGHPNKVIATAMDLSETTIKFHLRNIFSKLGVQNRMMAVEVARAKNIIQ